MRAARAVADVSAGLLLADVEIAAPIERVFRAISTAEVARWWGSDETYRVTRWVGELRVGAPWLSEGVNADGTPFSVGGQFLRIEPPRLLVQTWDPKWVEGPPTTLTWRLEPIDGGTRVTVRHEGFADNAAACRDHARGWELVLGWAARFLEAA